MRTLNKRTVSDLLFSVLKYFSLIFASIVALVPVVVCVLTAFKTSEEYQSTSPLDLPANFLNLDNFKEAWTVAKMFTGFRNTGIVLIVVLILSIFFSATLAAPNRKKWTIDRRGARQ